MPAEEREVMHGEPVAEVVPIGEPDSEPTMGSVRLLTDEDELYFSTGDSWGRRGALEPGGRGRSGSGRGQVP